MRPPFLLSRKVNEISAAIVQIVKERDTLLNKRVEELSKDVRQVKVEVTGTEDCRQNLEGRG